MALFPRLRGFMDSLGDRVAAGEAGFPRAQTFLEGLRARSGSQTPVRDFLGNHRNAFLGFAGGGPGWDNSWSGFAQGAQMDRQAREDEAEKARLEALAAETEQWWGGLYDTVRGAPTVAGGAVGGPPPSTVPGNEGSWMLAGSGATGTSSPPEIVYNNSGAIRNDPLAPQLETALQAAAAEAGIDRIVVASGGQEAEGEGGARTGEVRHDHGNAADVDLYVGDRLLDFTNPQDQAIYQRFVTAAVNNGVTGIGAGSDYMGNTRIHVGYGTPATWGAGGSGANAPEWLTTAYGAGGQPAAAPQPQAPAQGSPNEGLIRMLLSREETREAGLQMLVAEMTAGPDADRPQQNDEYGVPRWVDTGAEVFPGATAPPTEAAALPNDIELYNFYTEQETAAGRPVQSFNDWDLERRNRLGGIAPNLNQGQAANFAGLMGQADALLTNPERPLDVLGTNYGQQIVGGIGNFFGFNFTSQDFQAYEQAKRQFINAILRRESGATIRDEEFVNYEQALFPVPGNDEGIIEQKRQARALAIQLLQQQSGPLAPQPVGAPVAAGGGEAPIGTRVQMPDGTFQVKTELGWEPAP